MSGTEHNISIPSERRSACDNCKARKTKCDRNLPCASCITLNVACHFTRRPPERRQRVLLSPRYDETVQDVSRQLGEVKDMLQTLLSRNQQHVSPYPTTTDNFLPSAVSVAAESSTALTGTAHRSSTPRPVIDEKVPSLSGVHDGYKGDPSFQSHAQRVEKALEATLSVSELLNTETPSSPAKVTTPSPPPSSKPVSEPYDLDLENMPLPPLDAVLKVLRLTKVQKQRFFVDVPMFKEDEFCDMCRDVYFATNGPISLWTWICVNVGLYYILFSLSPANCARIMGTTVDGVRSQHLGVLRRNAEAAMQSLRLCSEPSMESCRALALLGLFYIKEGHITIAWRLMSSAARACLDLGYHRLPRNGNPDEIFERQGIFWFIYAWGKSLSMTCGRTAVIHHYDLIDNHPAYPEDRISVRGRLYAAWVDHAIITGEIQQALFSASAQRGPQQVRTQHARGFASRILSIRRSITSTDDQDPTWDELFRPIAIALEIMLYSLLTVVYRVVPPNSMQPHPLQCSDECVSAARMALSTLVRIGETALQIDAVAWCMFLNMILAMTPFVPFIVLAGNTIATRSDADLALLSSVMAILAPSAASSSAVRKIHDACERFRRIASLVVAANKGQGSALEPYVDVSTVQPSGNCDGQQQQQQQHQQSPVVDYGFPMTQQDWDNIMVEFESELGNYDSRALANIIEPYIAVDGW